MRGSSCSSPVRRSIAALVMGAAMVAGDVAAPAAHAVPSRAMAVHGDSGAGEHSVKRRVVRPARFRPRANRSAVRPRTRPRLRVAAAPRPLIPLDSDVWARLRRCESGGRYDINTGNGFYGAYQFVPRTWRGLGFAGMPHQAPPHIQDEAAQKLQARSGWGQWPACARKLGLR